MIMKPLIYTDNNQNVHSVRVTKTIVIVMMGEKTIVDNQSHVAKSDPPLTYMVPKLLGDHIP